MMVVRGTVPANTFGTHAANVVFHLPADRCVWTQVDNGGSAGYDIANARVFTATAEVAVSSPELGYIGKSGRFVKITA